MKKVAAVLALVLAAVALVACGGGEETTGETTTESGGAAATGEAGGAAAGGGAAEGGSAEGGGAEGGASEGGGSEGGGAEAGGSTVAFEADPNGQIAFTTTKATASAGKVTVNFNNPQPLEHDVSIEDSSGKTLGKTDLVAEGSASTTVSLKPGKYTFYCSVPGHREAGMEGTLTVK